MNDAPTLGQTIREVRIAAGLKGKDLSRKARINPTSLSFLELDKREPSLAQLRDIARVARVDPVAAFGRAALSLDPGIPRPVRRRARGAASKSPKGRRRNRSESNHGTERTRTLGENRGSP